MPDSQCTMFHLVLVSANTWHRPYPVYPLGVSYLASYLRQKIPQLQVSILDCNLDQVSAEELRKLAPDLIGVSLRNIDNVDSTDLQSFMAGYRKLLHELRNGSNAPIVLGGTGFSIYPDLLMQELQADYGIAGEGEALLAQLVVCLMQGSSPNDLPGVYRYESDTVCRHPTATEKLVPVLEMEEKLVQHYWSASGMLNIQTKRGCPYNCIYCSYPNIDGRTIRTLDPDQIVRTLQKLYDQYGIDYVFFTDSVFNIAPEFNGRLAQNLIAAAAPIRWGAYFSPYQLSPAQIDLYQQAGLTHIEFGTESLDDNTLKAYRKPFRYETIKQVSDHCHSIDLHYAHFMIVGGVGETQQSLDTTLARSQELSRTVFFPFFGMRIYPGTGLQTTAVAENLITTDDNLLQPQYYLTPGINYAEFKRQASSVQVRWVMPDAPESPAVEKLRKRGRRGPLWEYLIRA